MASLDLSGSIHDNNSCVFAVVCVSGGERLPDGYIVCVIFVLFSYFAVAGSFVFILFSNSCTAISNVLLASAGMLFRISLKIVDWMR